MATNYAVLAAMEDEDIDCSDLPELTKEYLDNTEGVVVYPELDLSKELICIKIDKNVAEFFKNTQDDYNVKINEILKDYINKLASNL